MSGDAIAQLSIEFLDDAGDRVDRIQFLVLDVEKGKIAYSDAFIDINREVHNLKGMGSLFGFPAVSMIAHRFEDYLKLSLDGGKLSIDDAQAFVDALSRIIAARENPPSEEVAATIRSLPVFGKDEIVASAGKSIEVLTVTRTPIIGHALTKELAQLGYSVISSINPFEAMNFAVNARPDLILTSAVLEGLNGIDLVRALRAIRSTQDIPVAVVTSFGPGHSELAGLPDDIPLVRIGSNLADDLADVLFKYVS